MTRRRLRQVGMVGSLVLLALLSVLSVLATFQRTQSRALPSMPATLAVGTELQRPRPVPNLRLIDDHGRVISVAGWLGKWVVLAPSMTLCHEVCPMTSAALTQLASDLRKAGLSHRVVVAEATVDPWRDSPARLRAYRRLTGVNFALLTGTRAEIRKLWKFFGVFYKRVPQGRPADVDWLTHRRETFDVAHTDALFFVDPQGRERIINVGMPSVGGRLPVTLRRLLNANGRANLAHPQLPWTTTEAFDDLYFLMGRNLPAGRAPTVTAPSAASAQKALAGSPSALASVHDQAGQLLGSENALVARISSLRGYPIVLNAWASWCGPCRAEFAMFGSESARYGRRVAFLGVTINDSASNARAFLEHHPVSYPSYQSASTQLAPFAALQGTPTTIYINRVGKVIGTHIGQYATVTTLQNDIAHFALGVSG